MAWRGLHISKAARLALADGQIVIDQEDGKVRLALEDIAWIVLDTPQATLTSALLSACMEAGIALIATDASHMPSGVVLPFHRHFRQGGVAAAQADLGAPLKKRLWQAIIQRKIQNQAAALDALGCQGAGPIREMARHVGSGDPDNVEARAARAYWQSLFVDFRRSDDGDSRNMLLNYGYAIARSAIARALVAVGLIPALGLKHASVTNAFNLADDLIEPFRPFVDILAWRVIGQGQALRQDLTLDQRRAMAGILLETCQMGPETQSLLLAGEKCATGFLKAMESGSPDLLVLPKLVP
jgi:CRISPR-associated protein Cas1